MPSLVVKNANLPGIEPRSSARNLTITLMVQQHIQKPYGALTRVTVLCCRAGHSQNQNSLNPAQLLQ